MRVLLVSDIHSNLVAFRAVLEDARLRGGWDAVWHMGDIVGYGPEPSACLDLLGELGAVSVAGNHDWGVLERVPITEFNYAAALANRWTAQQLSPRQRRYLEELPLTLQFDEFTLVHGSPRDPIWEYLMEAPEAKASFEALTSRHGTMGHTHIPAAFWLEPESQVCYRLPLNPEQPLWLGSGRWLINPGSVGQPRDRDPRAAYALLDRETLSVTAHRVEYDIKATMDRTVAVGLPVYLAERLLEGR